MQIRIYSFQFPGMKCPLRAEVFFQLAFLFHLVVFHPHVVWGQAAGQTATSATAARTIHGVVKSGNMPIPGSTISASNASTKEQINTWTDVDGSYRLQIPADGRYTVRVQMAAFAVGTQEAVLNAGHADI